MSEETTAFLKLQKGCVVGREVGDTFHLGSNVTSIGQPYSTAKPGVTSPDVRVDDPYASHDHLRIYYRPESQCFVVEEAAKGTKGGTFIGDKNGKYTKIDPGKPTPLTDGALIALAWDGSQYRVIFKFRRSEETWLPEEDAKPQQVVELPTTGLVVDTKSEAVWVNGAPVKTSELEFGLLAFLCKKHPEVCDWKETIKEVWNDDPDNKITDKDRIKQIVIRLRKKIEDDWHDPKYIVEVHGSYGLGSKPNVLQDGYYHIQAP